MAGKLVDLPVGVEVVGTALRIRFTWNKKRHCETLPFPATPKGIAAAAALRAQVVQLAKLGSLTSDRYAELFPNSRNASAQAVPIFFEYAQEWLNSQQVASSTRKNYLSMLQRYWIPQLATVPIDRMTPMLVRKVTNSIEWASPGRRKGAVRILSAVLNQAVSDELLLRNPAASIPKAKVAKREIDPFTRAEADLMIDTLYKNTGGLQTIYAALFEFLFYTGMRPGEAYALTWADIDRRKRTARINKIRIYGKIEHRTKSGAREVLLNDRALKALRNAESLTAARSDYVFAPEVNGDKSELYIRSETGPKRYWLSAMRKLGLRHRRMYDARHTYATMCLMAGMNPAFIASQLGHSVQMLLSTYARWINTASDWAEMQKLDAIEVGTNSVRADNR